MSRKTVLHELFEDNTRRVRHILDECGPDCLNWSVDSEANSIAVTIWHATRIFDVFYIQHIQGKTADNEIWHSSGWAEKTGYDPRGLGTNGWGAVTGYSLEEVRAISQMDADTLLGYYVEVVEAILVYLDKVSDKELDLPSKGFDGKQPNYFWVRHPLFDMTRHVGEMLAIKSIRERRP